MKKLLFGTLVVVMLIIVLLNGGGQAAPAPANMPMVIPTAPDPTATPAQPIAFTETLTVSYAEAADWLTSLPQEDHADQIRDWALWGLADLLKLDVETLRDAFYDQTPVRDPLFYGIATNAIGPGRALPDADGNLHILVPLDDAFPDRTVGMALDDYRKNSAVDPTWVLIYRYTIDYAQQQVTLQPEPAAALAAVRQAHGFVEMPLPTLSTLEDFLAQTTHLSYLELRDGTLWAGGWQWSNLPANLITAQDLTVLQTGYRQAAAPSAFDPSAILTPEQQKAWDFITAFEAAETDEEFGDLLFSAYVFNELLTPVERVDFEFKLAPAVSAAESEKIMTELVALVYQRITQLLSNKVGQRSAGSALREPGFSLDPGRSLSIDELLNLLNAEQFPGLDTYPEVVDFAVSLAKTTTGEEFGNLIFSDFVVDTLLSEEQVTTFWSDWENAETEQAQTEVYRSYKNLVFGQIDYLIGPSFTQLLFNTADGHSPYQAARYDGGLRGTEVGMTYYYTDLVAKAWSMEKGTGAPVGKVDGFVSDIAAKTPWGHCRTESGFESGRLWFGLRDEAVAASDTRIDLGSVATRVFTLADNPDGSETEVEPSYSFGRIIWWWDRHYLSMADYEPQYHRLDQLMRWGAAIAWLVDHDAVFLPEVPADQVKKDWRFDQWLAAHPEVKWSYDIPFVQPSDVTTEALLTLYSEPADDCGTTWVYSGGISSPAITKITSLRNVRPTLTWSVSRAGLQTTGTTFSSATRSGTIVDFSGLVRWNLKPIVNNAAVVETIADGRKVWSFGGLKAWVPETIERRIAQGITINPGGTIRNLRVQGVEIGNLSVSSTAKTATIRWQPSLLDRARTLTTQVQEGLTKPGASLQQAVSEAAKTSGAYLDDAGRAYLPIRDGAGLRWMQIEESLVTSSDDFAFRLGAPGATTNGPLWYTARLRPSLPVPVLADGNPAQWIAVIPEEQTPNLFWLRGVQQPAATAQKVPFRYAGSEAKGIVIIDGNQLIAAADDPLFGLAANAEQHLLLHNPLIRESIALQQGLRANGSPYAVGLGVGDETLLIDKTTGWIVPKNSPWHTRVQATLRQGSSPESATFKIQHNQAWIVTQTPGVKMIKSEAMALENYASPLLPGAGTSIRGPPRYLHSRLANEFLAEGQIPVGGIRSGQQVRVVTVELPANYVGKIEPDILTTGRTEWIRPWVIDVPPPLQDTQVMFAYIEGDCEETADGLHCEE